MQVTINAVPQSTISTPSNFTDLSITAGTGAVDADRIEGSDATDQIRDAVINDATRIDGSSVNAIEGKVDTIDGLHDVPSADSVNNLQMRDVIGNKNDSADHVSIIGRLEYLFAAFTELQSIYPNLAEGVEVIVANGEWAALPSPTQIIPASTITNQFIIIGVDVIDALGAFHLRLYTGAALSEVELTNVVGVNGSQSFLPCYALVDANERISCSITDSVAGADTYGVKIIYKEI
jgi:hypothetical protein